MTQDDGSSLLAREVFLAGFMSGLPSANAAWAFARLARTMTDVRVNAGELVYRKGEPAETHFFVVEGEVKLETDDAPTLTFGNRSLIGTFDVILGRPRSRTAVATCRSHLLRMPAADWLDMLEDNFELARSSVQGLAADVDGLRLALGAAARDALPPVAAAASNAAVGTMGLVDRIFALRAVPLFAGADVQALIELSAVARDISFEPGATVSARGEANDSLVVVLSGAVRGTRAEAADVERFGPGELVFGCAAAAADRLRHAAHAESTTRALTIAREDYIDVLEEHFPLALSSLRAVLVEREALVNAQRRRAAAVPDGSPTARAAGASMHVERR